MAATLIESNPFLRDAAARRRALLRSVASSSAIEGIRAPSKRGARVKPSAALARFIRLMRAASGRPSGKTSQSRD